MVEGVETYILVEVIDLLCHMFFHADDYTTLPCILHFLQGY